MQIPLISVWLSNAGMLIDELRRANLAKLVEEAGGVGKLADRLERDPSQVSQWLNASKNSGTGRPRGMRSDTCRFIESRMGKPSGWLDTDHSAQPKESDWPFPRLDQTRYDMLTPGQKAAIEDWVISQVNAFQSTVAVDRDHLA
ncbi:helix-turn-helix domain-containing protein [Bordetella avium]|nr:helix-turn-helix domain-containing protein [Bordetella avium]